MRTIFQPARPIPRRRRKTPPGYYAGVVYNESATGGLTFGGTLAGGGIAVASGPSSPATGANDASVGTIAWGTPSRVTASDADSAGVNLAVGEQSNYLTATNFGFAIAAGKTIVGVLVEIQGYEDLSNQDMYDVEVKLIKGGVVSGDNKASATEWPTVEAYRSYGGSADLWGLSLAPSDVNASNFGVAFTCNTTSVIVGSHKLNINHIRVTVYYADALHAAAPAVSGGLVFDGAASAGFAYVVTADGGLTFGGTNSPTLGVPMSGGVSLGGANSPTLGVPMSGGVVMGGAATVTTAYVTAATGGVVFGGAASLAASFPVSMSGGVTLGGAATASVAFVPSPSGGVEFAGSASPSLGVAMSGGLSLEGAATAVVAYVPTPSGGVSFAGSPTPLVAYTWTFGGGPTFGGTWTVASSYTAAMSGGPTFGGSATAAAAYVEAAAGGVAFGGAWTVSQGFVVTPSGGVSFAGSAAVDHTVFTIGTFTDGGQPVYLEGRPVAVRIRPRPA